MTTQGNCGTPFPKLIRLARELAMGDEDSYLGIYPKPYGCRSSEYDNNQYIKPIPSVFIFYRPNQSESERIELWLAVPLYFVYPEKESLYDIFKASPLKNSFQFQFRDFETALFESRMEFSASEQGIKDACRLITAILRFYGISQMSEVVYEILPCEKCDNKKSVVLISAVHGADFWKEAVRLYPNKEIVFMGNYFAPSDRTKKDSDIRNFLEIVHYAETNKKCHLLLSDSDLEIIGQLEEYVHKIIMSNKSLFYSLCIGLVREELIAISPSVITTEWYDIHHISPSLINTTGDLLKKLHPIFEWSSPMDDDVNLTFLEIEASDFASEECHTSESSIVKDAGVTLYIDGAMPSDAPNKSKRINLPPCKAYLLSIDLTLTQIGLL